MDGWVGGWVRFIYFVLSFYPPTHPERTVARSNRLLSLYPLNYPPTHPPTHLVRQT